MHYSLAQNNWQPEQVHKLSALLACQDIRLVTKQGGGNSVVYCIEAAGRKWAVKSYPPYAPGQRDRLAAEVMVYQFLNQHGIPSVPTLNTYSESERWLVMDWIEGEVPQHYGTSDIEQAVKFIQSISRLNTLPNAKKLPLAAEACLSLTILLDQIRQRFERLQAITDEHVLQRFLSDEFEPVLVRCHDLAMAGYHEAGIDPDSALPQEKRSLIPADFGFHNTIRDRSGKLYFFDFDYFGWDDPVKLLADVLWHPKMQLSDQQKQTFIRGFSGAYAHDAQFLSRFRYTWSLFGLRWVLILLNEFIPAFWQNRQHANVYQNQIEAKKIQLKRAKDLLLNLQQIGCPYEVTTATSI